MTTSDTGAIAFRIAGGPTEDILVDKVNSGSPVEFTISSVLMIGGEAISREHGIVVNIDNNTIYQSNNGMFKFKGTNSRGHEFEAEYNPQDPSGSITFQ